MAASNQPSSHSASQASDSEQAKPRTTNKAGKQAGKGNRASKQASKHIIDPMDSLETDCM